MEKLYEGARKRQNKNICFNRSNGATHADRALPTSMNDKEKVQKGSQHTKKQCCNPLNTHQLNMPSGASIFRIKKVTHPDWHVVLGEKE